MKPIDFGNEKVAGNLIQTAFPLLVAQLLQLMAVFTEDDAYNGKFPVTSNAKHRYKLTEEGRQKMTAALEKIMVEERNEGLAEGITKGRIDTLISLVYEGILTIPQAAAKAGESEQSFSQRLQQ